MKRVKYLGYWGNPNADEDEQMGLVPHEVYPVLKTVPCNFEDPSSDCHEPLPFVLNKEGQEIMLTHGEFEDVDAAKLCSCEIGALVAAGCKCGGA